MTQRMHIESGRPADLLFDLDNTLVRCSEYYQLAYEQFYGVIQAALPGVPLATIKERFHALESEYMSRGDFTVQRLPMNMREAYRSLCAERLMTPRPSVEDACYAAGESILHAPYLVYDGVKEMLQSYRNAGHRLGLCTKGEQGLQRRKLEMNGLDGLFHIVEIQLQKPPQLIRSLADRLSQGRPGRGVMIGDSRRDDITGGIQAGLDTVWISRTAFVEWSYEDGQDHVVPTHTLERAADLPRIISVARSLKTPPAHAARRTARR